MKHLLSMIVLATLLLQARGEVRLETNQNSLVITVEGEAGQIGKPAGGHMEFMPGMPQNFAETLQQVTAITVVGNINANDIHALLENTQHLETLDLGNATIETMTYRGSEWDLVNATFAFHDYSQYNKLKHLVLPKVTATDTQGTQVAGLGKIFFNIETVVIPEGYTSIGFGAFSGRNTLTAVSLPQSLTAIGRYAFNQTALTSVQLPNNLKTIGDYAFQQVPNNNPGGLKTIVFPASLEYIGQGAFSLTYLKDVYFLGRKAPRVAADAFDSATHYGNNGFVPEVNGVDAKKRGVASRENYKNNNQWFGMLHLRPDLTLEERRAYTDVTREYKVEPVIYWGNVVDHYLGFADLYVGEKYVWPGQEYWNKAYTGAQTGTLWNGQPDPDKAIHEGLYKFVLVSYDANQTTTDNLETHVQGGRWYSFCVPFNMTKEEIDRAFGPNTQVCMLNKVVRDAQKKTITINFQDDKYLNPDGDYVVLAHHAYMIHPTIDQGNNITIPVKEVVEGSPVPTAVQAQTPEGWLTEYTYNFVGNTQSTCWKNNKQQSVSIPAYSYAYGTVNNVRKFFYLIDDKAVWKPYTAVVQVFKDGVNEGVDDKFVVENGAKTVTQLDDVEAPTTDIEQVEMVYGNGDAAQTVVYDLRGNKVANTPADAQKLPAGIYVVNGKKVMMK